MIDRVKVWLAHRGGVVESERDTEGGFHELVLRLPDGKRHHFAYTPYMDEDERIGFLEEVVGPKL